MMSCRKSSEFKPGLNYNTPRLKLFDLYVYVTTCCYRYVSSTNDFMRYEQIQNE